MEDHQLIVRRQLHVQFHAVPGLYSPSEGFQAVLRHLMIAVVQSTMRIQPSLERTVVRLFCRRGDQPQIYQKQYRQNSKNPPNHRHVQSSPTSKASNLLLGGSGLLSPCRVRLMVTKEIATITVA